MTTSHASAHRPVGFGPVPARGLEAVFDESSVSASTYSVPTGFLGLIDVLTLVAAALLSWRLMPLIQRVSAAERLGRVPGLSWLALPPAAAATGLQPFGEIAWVPFVMIPVTLLFVHMLGGYRPVLEQSRTRLALSSIVAPMFGLSIVTLIIIAVRNQHMSRALIFSFALLSAAGLLATRKAIRFYKFRRLRAGYYARNVVVIGPESARPWFVEHFAAHVSPHFYRLYGWLGITADAPEPAAQTDAGGPAVLGTVEHLGELLIRQPIHDVIAVQGRDSERWLRETIERCEYFQIVLRLVPEALLGRESRDLPALFGRGPLKLPEIVLRPGYLNTEALFIKRLFDIVVSAVLLLLLSPFFLVIAIAIKITTPELPVFFPWRVIGYKGRPFTGYKFTTMRADAAQREAELRHLNEMQGPVFKIKANPSITPLGRWLRKFSLNELPQLWSVLKGDMSLVGPRPAYATELARYELWHKRKLCVQPGITCLWQVRGRNKITSFDDWVTMDFEYIDHWSLWLDCRILLRTAWAVIAGTGS